MDKFSFYLVTDTHYFDNSYKRSGEAYERRSRTDQKCVAETPAIIDAGFAQLAKDKETDVILIPGDLIYNIKAMWVSENDFTDLKNKESEYI